MLVFPWLAALLLAAHFFRGGEPGLALAVALMPSLLLVRRRWAFQVVALAFVAGGVEWVLTTAHLVSVRAGYGEPWGRMALILGAVAAFTWLSAWLVWRRRPAEGRDHAPEGAWLASATFLLVAGLLCGLRRGLDLDLLLLDRFLPGFGPVEILALAVYGAFLGERLRAPETQTRWRVSGLADLLCGVFRAARVGTAGLRALPDDGGTAPSGAGADRRRPGLPG